MSDDDSAISDFLAQPDFYKAMGINRSFKPKELTARYRELAARFHPDRNKNPRAAEAFAKLANIKDTLGDDRKRFEYDQKTYSFPSIRVTRAEEAPAPAPAPKARRRIAPLVSVVAAFLILIYALNGEGSTTPRRLRREKLRKVIQFRDPGADFELFWTDPGQKRFYLPRGWLKEHGIETASDRVKMMRLADSLFWEHAKEMCEKESAKPGASKPHCAELQNKMM